MMLKPLVGALHTVPAAATEPASLASTRVQMNMPPLLMPVTCTRSVSTQNLARMS